MRGVALIQATYVLCSILILVSSAPFEKEIRTSKEEKHVVIPPVIPAIRQLREKEIPKREENSFADEKDNPEVDARELAENEFPAKKIEREFREENAEEFFKRLERELAMKMARKASRNENENENERWNLEVKRNDEEREEKELPEEMFEDDEEDTRNLAKEKEFKMFYNRELENDLEERLAREIETAEEENERELGGKEERMEVVRSPERMYERGLLPEESEEIANRELKTEFDVEEHKRESSEEESKNDQEDEAEHFRKNERSFMEYEDPALKHKREEEERLEIPREVNIRRMLEESAEEIPEWNKKFVDNRVRASEELSRRTKESPKHMREREAERERERFDHHGNRERKREKFRERQRERALENGQKVHDREMEERKQREKIGSHGTRQEERERFRFRAHGE